MDKNPEFDTTLFVNIDGEAFDIFYGGECVRHLEAGESKEVPIFIATLGMKHLIDRVLGKQGVKNTMQDTPARNSLKAQILPNWAEEKNVKPLSEDDYKKAVQEQLESQGTEIKQLKEEITTASAKDKAIEALTKKVEELEAKLNEPKGRKPANK